MNRARRRLASAIVVVGMAGVFTTVGARQTRTTFAVPDPITAVEVESEAGAVDVVVAGDRGTTIVQTARALLGGPTIEQSVVDGVLRLRASCPRLGAAVCQVDYRLELPPTLPVRVRTGRGDVSVEDMAGAVDVTSTEGSISLARTSGPVTARTSQGSVEGVDLAPPFLDASTRGGPISVSLAKPAGRVDVQSRSGSVDLALPADRYRVETATGRGRPDIGVVVDATSGYVVRATTVAGGVRIRPR